METIVTTIITPAIRHGMTVAAGALVAAGLLEPAQSNNFTLLATGIVVGGIGLVWSFVKNAKKK